MDYKAALYIRLSREDDDKETSSSVINQNSLLLQYTKENNIKVYDTYIDDGYSGTTFDRPAFNRLIKDIENKKINMVITKDMSRLGRDYIGTGNLIEKYFPQNNVRFIAVTDNIDTYLDNVSLDIAPFKAIMNDMYAKDISKKIRSSLRAKMKEGKFVGARAPYGYQKDKKDKNHLIVNRKQSIIVKKIYNMALNGLSTFQIAKKLTEDNIKNPSSYYDFKWQNKSLHNTTWNSKTIRDILTNKTYTGDTIQNKRNKVNYKVNKIVKTNPQDYIISKNTHTPIISIEIFNKVQSLLPKNQNRIDKKEHHLLEGLLYCGECSHRISITPRRKKDNKCYTICNYYRQNIKSKLCTSHSNNYDTLEKTIITKLKKEYLPYINKKIIKDEIITRLKKEQNNDNIIQKIEIDIHNINDNLDTIYLDNINNKITTTQYNRLREKLIKELQIKEEELIILKDKNNIKEEAINIETYLSEDYISRDLIINLIEKIEIHEDKTIDIKFTFKSIL